MADARVDERVLLWLEVKRNIGALQLVLNPTRVITAQSHYDKNTRVRIEICVRPKSITVRRFPGEKCALDFIPSSAGPREVNILLKGDITVEPRLCQGLNVIGKNELHMRLSLKKDLQTPNDHFWSLGGNGDESELKLLKQMRPCTLCCRTCRKPIVKMQKGFKRVLQLPSEFLQQMSVNLYCHNQNHLPVAMATIGPHEMDCLVGEKVLVVHQSAVAANSVHVEQKNENLLNVSVKCRRCLMNLGTIGKSGGATLSEANSNSFDTSDGAVTLYKHMLITETNRPGLNIFRNYSSEGYITATLLKQTQGAVGFKFLVQGRDSRTYAMLWLMPSTDLSIETNCPPWKRSTIQDLLETRYTSLRSDEDKPRPVLKILYNLTLHEKENNLLLKEWQESPAVKEIRFSNKICLELVLLLLSSTYTLPPTMRTMDGFQVGFLYKT